MKTTKLTHIFEGILREAGRKAVPIENVRDALIDEVKARDEEEYNQCEGVTAWGRCPKNVNERQASYSKTFYKKTLCWSCQQKEGVSEK